MKTSRRLMTFLFFFLVLLSISCRKEEAVLIEMPAKESLKANSSLADVLLRTAMNDGSGDNIIDNSNCFNIALPVTVKANGQEIMVDSEEDFDLIEAIFDEFDNDTDVLEIIFPITVVLSDFTEIWVNNLDEFNTLSNTCHGENEYDHDIECVDIQYPVIASVFNSTNELLNTITITSDKELYDFIHNLDENDIVTVGFPVTIILSDGTEQQVSNLSELENIIINAIEDCDEDDDFDYNDDDCNNCSTNQLSDILIGCSNWSVDKLERNNYDLEDQYLGYQFNFMADGSLSANTSNTTFYGTWESDGSGNNISVTINIPNLSDFNAIWNLHEIEQYPSETKVDLRIAGDDRLRFESYCP